MLTVIGMVKMLSKYYATAFIATKKPLGALLVEELM